MKSVLPHSLSLEWKPRQKKRVDFGSQIRSYVLDRDEVVDHRTGKRASARAVLEGNVDLLR